MDCCAAKRVRLPANITVGLSFKFEADICDYPAPTWIAALHLRGPASIDLTATADGTKQLFQASTTTTATWTAGTYWAVLRVTNGSQLLEVGKSEINILPDLTLASVGYDGRTQNEIAYAAIQAVIAKRATQDQERYRINNRELWRTPMADLLKLLSFYRVAVQREKNKAAGRSTFGRAINVRFSDR